MNYTDSVAGTVRVTIRNPFAIVLVSLATTVSVVPFVTGFLVADIVGSVVGLWTTSFMLGFVAVGGARIATVTLEREVSLGTDYFWNGIHQGRRMGLAIGLGTFVSMLTALLAVANPVGGVVGLSVSLVGVYLVLVWFTLATFTLAIWASSGDDVLDSFLRGGTLILEEPISAVWLLVQAVGWTLLAIPLVLPLVLVLPGFVQLLGISIVRRAAQYSSSHSIRGLSEQ